MQCFRILVLGNGRCVLLLLVVYAFFSICLVHHVMQLPMKHPRLPGCLLFSATAGVGRQTSGSKPSGDLTAAGPVHRLYSDATA